MTFPKRTFEKPIPISPTIALDRERCILCYRCTRFSESVSEDGQLVTENRGAQSVISTFEDEPYRARFSGDVIELCPVGALTSTQYRFEGRPWEIQNVPTVCGLCPVGCNVAATTREGKVKRILSRNHPEVDEGWLCDKGRFGFPALRAADRVTAPLKRSGGRRFGEASWDEALDKFEQLARAAGSNVVLALSGSETVELAYSLSRLVREGFGARTGARRSRLRRLPPAGDAERERGRRRVERGRRRRAGEARPDRLAARLRRRDRARHTAARARRPRGEGGRDRHVRRGAAALRRPPPARDELPGARRDDGQPRKPRAAAPPRGDA